MIRICLWSRCQTGDRFPAAVSPKEKDPFWDPVEPLLLGTAHLWLQSLAFRIPLEEQLEVRTAAPTHRSGSVRGHGDVPVVCSVCRFWGQRAQRRPSYRHSWSPAVPQDCMDTHTHTHSLSTKHQIITGLSHPQASG